MAQPRESPYIWVSWLSKLLAGDAHCEWALWFRAHNTYDKQRDETFDLAAWAARHAEMVRTRSEELRVSGYKVFVEDQNKFTLIGSAGALGGKADIVAVREAETLVVDCKTGAPHSSDVLQVLVYMLVLPMVHAACKGRTMAGEVRYADHPVRIAPEDLTADLRDLIRAIIGRAAGAEPTPKVPSYAECSFCDITAADCPERVDAQPPVEKLDHDLF